MLPGASLLKFATDTTDRLISLFSSDRGRFRVPFVSMFLAPAAAAPVTGNLAATGSSAALVPDLGRPIWLTLSGIWTGTVKLERSTDGGVNWNGATAGGAALSFTALVNEPVAYETVAGARWRIAFTRATGALAYELRQ